MNNFTYQETLALAKQIEEEHPEELKLHYKLSEPLVLNTQLAFKSEKSQKYSRRYLWSGENTLSIHVTKQTLSRV